MGNSIATMGYSGGCPGAIALGGYYDCKTVTAAGKRQHTQQVIASELQHDMTYYRHDDLMHSLGLYRLGEFLTRLDLHTMSDLRYYLQHNLTHETYHKLDLQVRTELQYVLHLLKPRGLRHYQTFDVLPDVTYITSI